MTEVAQQGFDVVVIGGGPAGLSAALNLVRARRRTLVLDSNRPRNAATLAAHGFLTRDGVSPLELRRLGREEIASYAEGEVAFARVTSVEREGVDSGAAGRDGGGFVVSAAGIRGERDWNVRSRVVLIASGLVEELPPLPSIRTFYGTTLHSCIECDGYERAGGALALIGSSNDLAERALLLSQWSDDLIVFTNGSDAVSADDERMLASRGVGVERREIADVEGERDRVSGIRLTDGHVIARDGGFVRPTYRAQFSYARCEVETCDDGLVKVDAGGRTSVAGLYATGDVTPPGPEQLIVAAGHGARVAAAINRDLLA